jgi:hypothetical protein
MQEVMARIQQILGLSEGTGELILNEIQKIKDGLN